MFRTRIALMLTLATAALPACAGADDPAADGSAEVEENLESGATRIAKGLGGPSNFQVVGTNLFYSTSFFVASGDPELDQQMAYWTGESWMKPLAGGTKKRIDELGVQASANTGKSVISVQLGGFNVDRVSLPSGSSKNIFHVRDMSEEPYGPISAIAYGNGRVYVGQEDGTILSVTGEGGDEQAFITTPRHGDWQESISKVTVAGDQLVWSTIQSKNSGGHVTRLYRAPLTGSRRTATSLGEIDDVSATSLVSDGTNAFAGIAGRDSGYILRLPLSGSARTSRVVEDYAPDELAMDSTGLFYSVTAKGVFMVPKDKLGSGTTTSKRVYSAKNVSSFALSDKDLYVGVSPGHPNQKKGEIHKLPRTKFPR
ncbi:MAG: hypothetical protein U0174_16325 [Polyangiaceae bacterium]